MDTGIRDLDTAPRASKCFLNASKGGACSRSHPPPLTAGRDFTPHSRVVSMPRAPAAGGGATFARPPQATPGAVLPRIGRDDGQGVVAWSEPLWYECERPAHHTSPSSCALRSAAPCTAAR